MLDFKTFTQSMTGLAEVYEKEVSEVFLKMYYQVLKSLTKEQFDRAIQGILATNKFHKFPLPAEFLDFAFGNPDDKANLALLKLEDGIKKYGFYDSVQFDDPLIHKAVESLGGWTKISGMTMDEWTWAKKDFLRIYKSLAKTPNIECPIRLVGFHESTNTNKGYINRIPETIQIGSKLKQIAG